MIESRCKVALQFDHFVGNQSEKRGPDEDSNPGPLGYELNMLNRCTIQSKHLQTNILLFYQVLYTIQRTTRVLMTRGFTNLSPN